MGAFANLDGGPWLEKNYTHGNKLGWAKGNGHSGRGDVDKNSMPATRPEIWPKLLFEGKLNWSAKKILQLLSWSQKKRNINQKFEISEIALITEMFNGIAYYYLAERNRNGDGTYIYGIPYMTCMTIHFLLTRPLSKGTCSFSVHFQPTYNGV